MQSAVLIGSSVAYVQLKGVPMLLSNMHGARNLANGTPLECCTPTVL